MERSREPFLVFGSPLIGAAEIAEVTDCLQSGWLGTGPKVERFEEAFRRYRGAEHSVALNSCTAALHLALICADLEPGDEVITTALTFCATVNAIIHSGARPVIVDIDPRTMNMDLDALEAAITPRTKAVLPVHFAGRPCDMSTLMRIAEKHGLQVIEDCAHAIEAEWKGRAAGTFGRFGCFSFYVTKNLATGEGGMILTADENLAGRVKILALHGMSKDAWHRYSDKGYQHYDIVDAGFKYNMMDLQAALGLHQLARIEENWKIRARWWDLYSESLADLPLVLPSRAEPDTRHALHLFTTRVSNESRRTRDQLLADLNEVGIGTGVHYLSLAEYSYYQNRFGWRVDEFPAARDVGRSTLSLPFSAKLMHEDVLRVVEAMHSLLG